MSLQLSLCKKSLDYIVISYFLVVAEKVIKSSSNLSVFSQVCNKPLITSSIIVVPRGASGTDLPHM